MKRKNWRIFLGVFLLALGVLVLLQTLGFIPMESSLFALGMGTAFGLGGGFFLYLVITGHKENWWAAIPGVILLTLGLMIGMSALFPRAADVLAGPFFLAGLSLSFWLVFLITPENWWAIIPGGVMLTLAAITLLSNSARTSGLETGGILFLGMAVTFALVALLPRGERRMSWPWIPASILAVMGALLSLSAVNLLNYVWPVALIGLGLYLVIKSVLRK